MTILLREAIGDRLRHARTKRSRTLRDVSRAARVSLGYLSEVERGRKEASSELLASICEALELPMADLLHNVASDIGAVAGVEQVDAVREPATSGVGGHGGSMERGRGMERGAGIDSGRIVSKVVQGSDLAELRIASPLSKHLPTTSIDTASLTAASGVTVAA